MADTPRATGAPPDTIIIDAPPGGPRGVKKVIIFGFGALPYDQRRYFCRVCQEFTGATGNKGDVCTINPGHRLLGKKPPRGRPPRLKRYGGQRTAPAIVRMNFARSVFGTYLSWLSYFQYLAWWRRHAPETVWDEIFEENYSALTSWPGGDKGREWNENRAPAALVIQRLARRHGLSQTTMRQLIREGRWWDAVEQRFLGHATTRAGVERDSLASLLTLCKRALLRGGRRRLSEHSARELRTQFAAIKRKRQRKWRDALLESVRAHAESVENRDRLVEVLRNPSAPGALDAAAELAGKIHVSPRGSRTGPMLLDHVCYVINDPHGQGLPGRAREWFGHIDPRLAGTAIWPGVEALLAHVREKFAKGKDFKNSIVTS